MITTIFLVAEKKAVLFASTNHNPRSEGYLLRTPLTGSPGQ